MMAANAVGIDPFLAADAGEGAKAAINAIRHATKAKSPDERAALIRQAQTELRNISAAKHPQIVNAIQARLLALQGRGGDTEIAHVTPGEVVIPRQLQTPEIMKRIAETAERQGIDPRQLTVGHYYNNINPNTGAMEFVNICSGNIGECEIRDPRMEEIVVRAYLDRPGVNTFDLNGGGATVDMSPRGSIGPSYDGGGLYQFNGNYPSDPKSLNASDTVKQFIRQKEGDRDDCYPSLEGGTMTCGIGHKLKEGEQWNPAQKEPTFAEDIAEAEGRVRRLVTVPLTQPQFDALVSLAYSTREKPAQGVPGSVGWSNSKMLQQLNAGNYSAAAREFLDWTGGGLPGLVQRRADEYQWFGLGTNQEGN